MSSHSRQSDRLTSLDIFRGATIAAMVVVNTPGSAEESYAQLVHARWDGWTFADVIFPFFLWIMGVALALSTASRVRLGERGAQLLVHAVRRSVVIFCCGVLLVDFIFPVRTFPYFVFAERLQVTGVLQKIAVCYLLAFVISQWTGWRGVALAIAALNLIYLGLLYYYPVPGCGTGNLTPECNFARYLDASLVEGQVWGGPGAWDPDGPASCIPATSTVLLGVLAGYLLRQPARVRTSGLLAMGVAWCAAGMLLAHLVPINKHLWTPSFVFVTAGLACICLAFVYWVADVKQQARRFKPLEVLGMNAFAAYVVSQVGINLPKVHFFGKTLYGDVYRQHLDPPNASLVYALAYLACVYGIVWLMHRHRWFLTL